MLDFQVRVFSSASCSVISFSEMFPIFYHSMHILCSSKSPTLPDSVRDEL